MNLGRAPARPAQITARCLVSYQFLYDGVETAHAARLSEQIIPNPPPRGPGDLQAGVVSTNGRSLITVCQLNCERLAQSAQTLMQAFFPCPPPTHTHSLPMLF